MEGSSGGPLQLSKFELEFVRIHLIPLYFTSSSLETNVHRGIQDGTNDFSIFLELPRRGTRNYSFQTPRLGIDPSR